MKTGYSIKLLVVVTATVVIVMKTITVGGMITQNPITSFLVPSISEQYYRRLKLPQQQEQEQKPTIQKLQNIVEAHLGTIPFENIGQHGGLDGLQTMNIRTIVDKFFKRNRGGFCLELNYLLGYWLYTELCYPTVTHVLASLYIPKDDNNNSGLTVALPSHMILIVETADGDERNDNNENNNNENNLYFVDVGFGEPPIHPLKYIMDIEQVTPDGMISKFTKEPIMSSSCNNKDDVDDEYDSYVTLHWYKNNEWIPRLRWKYMESMSEYNNNRNKNNNNNNEQKNNNNNEYGTEDKDGDRTMIVQKNQQQLLQERYKAIETKFDAILKRVQEPESNFSKKLIVCLLSRTHKYTVAGTMLKITGPPRFRITTAGIKNDSTDPPVSIKVYNNNKNNNNNNDDHGDSGTEQLRMVLYETFGIPLHETQTIDFAKSARQEHTTVWSAM